MRRHHDLKGADRRGRAPGAPILVSPADHRVPAAVGQLLPPACAIAERKRHAESTGEGPVWLHLIDGDQTELPIMFKLSVTVIEAGDGIMPHELRNCGLDLGTEYAVQQVGALGEGGDSKPSGFDRLDRSLRRARITHRHFPKSQWSFDPGSLPRVYH